MLVRAASDATHAVAVEAPQRTVNVVDHSPEDPNLLDLDRDLDLDLGCGPSLRSRGAY